MRAFSFVLLFAVLVAGCPLDGGYYCPGCNYEEPDRIGETPLDMLVKGDTLWVLSYRYAAGSEGYTAEWVLYAGDVSGGGLKKSWGSPTDFLGDTPAPGVLARLVAKANAGRPDIWLALGAPDKILRITETGVTEWAIVTHEPDGSDFYGWYGGPRTGRLAVHHGNDDSKWISAESTWGPYSWPLLQLLGDGEFVQADDDVAFVACAGASCIKAERMADVVAFSAGVTWDSFPTPLTLVSVPAIEAPYGLPSELSAMCGERLLLLSKGAFAVDVSTATITPFRLPGALAVEWMKPGTLDCTVDDTFLWGNESGRLLKIAWPAGTITRLPRPSSGRYPQDEMQIRPQTRFARAYDGGWISAASLVATGSAASPAPYRASFKAAYYPEDLAHLNLVVWSSDSAGKIVWEEVVP